MQYSKINANKFTQFDINILRFQIQLLPAVLLNRCIMRGQWNVSEESDTIYILYSPVMY